MVLSAFGFEVFLFYRTSRDVLVDPFSLNVKLLCVPKKILPFLALFSDPLPDVRQEQLDFHTSRLSRKMFCRVTNKHDPWARAPDLTRGIGATRSVGVT